MTKSELIARLASRFPQLTAADTADSVNAILSAITARLASKGGRVEVRGFGSFSIHVRPPRRGRNPKTGAKVDVPAKAVPHFKPGVEMRERVNGPGPFPSGRRNDGEAKRLAA
jgi:integration host factor subunit beta